MKRALVVFVVTVGLVLGGCASPGADDVERRSQQYLDALRYRCKGQPRTPECERAAIRDVLEGRER